MIKNVSIRNFKSIKELDFKAKRVNVFIGEPNTGKSNILEALGMFSLIQSQQGTMPIRYQSVSNLFYDSETHHKELLVRAAPYTCRMTLDNDDAHDNYMEVSLSDDKKGEERSLFTFNLVKAEREVTASHAEVLVFPIKHYLFQVLEKYDVPFTKYLLPPHGENLFEVIKANRNLKSMLASLVKEQGYRLGLRIQAKEIETIKEIEDILYTYPYRTLSDTLQRIIFYWAIIETNKNSTILLEEPESHMSPFYIRDIADRIAHDLDNQYLLATHNPYFLIPLVEKTKLSDLNIFVSYLENYQTKLKQLTKHDIGELTEMDTDVFFNLDKFFEVESIY